MSTEDEVRKRLYEVLPILPDPPTTRIALTKKLGVSGTKLYDVIKTLSSDSTVYEDFGEIGRIK